MFSTTPNFLTWLILPIYYPQGIPISPETKKTELSLGHKEFVGALLLINVSVYLKFEKKSDLKCIQIFNASDRNVRTDIYYQ